METIKEAAERFYPEKFFREHERLVFEVGVTWAEHWIPVEEELPQLPNKETFDVEHDYNQVLVKNEGYGAGLTNVYDEEDILWIKTNFTHWRPIEHK